MRTQHARLFSRRQFLGGLTLAGTAGLLGVHPRSVTAEPPPETTRLRLIQAPTICQAAQFVAEAFFRTEGFTDLEYIKKPGVKGIETALASGEASMNMHFNARLLMEIDAGDPVVILAGGHSGCFELFGTERVRTIRDLKGKTVGVLELASSQHAFISSMAAYVGLDPQKDITWVTQPPGESMQQLVDGKIDAFLGFPPPAPGVAGDVASPERPERARGGQQHGGSALVPVRLLHGGGQPGVRPAASGRRQAGATGNLPGQRPDRP